MAKGNNIIVSDDPKGRIINGYVDGTPLPGTIMQIKAATEPVGNRFTWEAFNRAADGDRPQGPIAVLLEDVISGKTKDDAYVDGDPCRMYCPLPGDMLNVRWSATGTGTGDSVAIGDLAVVNDGDGLLIDTASTPESEPFVALETVADVVAAGTLVWSMFTGY